MTVETKPWVRSPEFCKKRAKECLQNAAYEEKHGKRSNADWWRSRASLWLRRSTQDISPPNLVHSMDLEMLHSIDSKHMDKLQ